jgi:pyruvate/2-oxoglutarate dehydrogenase complex dihydrolipoamide dehydrogenase (E3) component
MELQEVPEHLLVLGGGFVGAEFGQMFRRFGSRVSLLERSSRLLPREDEDVWEAVKDVLEDDGIDIHLETLVESLDRGEEGGVVARVRRPSGEEASIHGSHLLLAVGRTPNTDALAPEAAGLEMDDAGYIRVNDRLETSVPGIYALGDINGGPPFTHIAYDDFRVVRKNVLENGSSTRAGRVLPYALFTDPELGRVGLTETRAREEGHRIRVARIPMARVARAMERDETRGFLKAVVDADTERILGAAVLGVNGGEVVTLFQLAMMGNLPWSALADGVFIHPTLAESLNTLFAGFSI